MCKNSGDNACLRNSVVIYNAFYWVSGPAVAGLGIWLYIKLGEFESILDRQQLAVPAFILISSGAASVLAGLLGCLGGLNQNRRLLAVFSLFMFVVCAMDIISAVLIFLDYDLANSRIENLLNKMIQDYDNNIQIIDRLQAELKCCGSKDFTDWLAAPAFRRNTSLMVAPLSCCLSLGNRTGCNLGNSSGVIFHAELLFQKGCSEALSDWLHSIYFIGGWIAAGVAATMVLGLSVVCCLKHGIALDSS